jgi:hypothetical protein
MVLTIKYMKNYNRLPDPPPPIEDPAHPETDTQEPEQE